MIGCTVFSAWHTEVVDPRILLCTEGCLLGNRESQNLYAAIGRPEVVSSSWHPEAAEAGPTPRVLESAMHFVERGEKRIKGRTTATKAFRALDHTRQLLSSIVMAFKSLLTVVYLVATLSGTNGTQRTSITHSPCSDDPSLATSRADAPCYLPRRQEHCDQRGVLPAVRRPPGPAAEPLSRWSLHG